MVRETKNKNQTKKQTEQLTRKRDVQRLSSEIIMAKKILRKIVKLLGAKDIEIELTIKEREFLTYE